MTIAEDMSYNHGPMISEATFREFLLPYYKRIIPEIKKYGTKVFVDTDGNVEMMLPWLMDAGVDGVLPLERQAGVDLPKYRKKYPNFLFIGGFDKMCMLKGKEAIRQEVERLLPVVRSGRYIMSMDHQTPPGTTLENYRYYIELMKQTALQACKDCRND
jgi:uroporphyrinogen-III decarboxylase